MDAKKQLAFAFYFFLGLSLIACEKKKTVETVFPESVTPSACASMAKDNEFIIAWEDGRISTEVGLSESTFVETVLEPNLPAIKRVERHKRLYLSESELQSASLTEVDSWGQEAIEAPSLWAEGIYGQGIKVAIVDSGTDYDHPQLASRLDKNLAEAEGAEGVDDDDNGLVDDIYGWDFFDDKAKPTLPVDATHDHGTHVAGIVAASHDEGPIKGVAPQAKLIPIKFLDADKGGTIDKAITAIKYAAGRGAHIINASWGGAGGEDGGGCSEILRDVIASVEKKGILFVAAAGNEGINTDQELNELSFPASYNLPNIISVASSRFNGVMSSFSNYGFKRVHLVAPGSDIWSTIYTGSARMSGTSMATPMVSGAAALLWSAKPNATYAQIKQALFSSVVNINGFNYAVSTKGHMNVRRALEELNRIVP